MGIQDLYQIIKEHAPEHLVEYHLSELVGYRFAIDISVFLYKYIRSAGENKWMDVFILFLCTLKKYGIKAVCVFDGPNPPAEKKEEQQRRRAENEKIIHRLKECIRYRDIIFEKYLQINNITDVPPEFIEDCKSLIKVKKGYVDVTNYNDIQDISNALNSVIDRLSKQTIPITDDYRKGAFEIVEMLGLAAFNAPGEAETMCSYMCINGMVDGVLTEDTDVLAYGTPFMFAFKDFKLHEEKVFGIHLPSLLEDIGLDVDEFRDLCILLSCDYNKRVKGYPPGNKYKKPVGIGASHAFSMIQEYRRLEEVENHVIDVSPLKYRRCRELFTVPEKMPNCKVPFNKNINFEDLENFINLKKINIKVEYIKKHFSPIQIQIEYEE